MRPSEKCFTLLEVLVASLLLGMLVTILTMMFSQSSVAWRIGTAGVADLDQKRQNIATWHEEADAALPHAKAGDPSAKYRIVSPWDEYGKIRTRSVERVDSQSVPSGLNFGRPSTWQDVTVQGNGKSLQFKSFVVGVTSAGPDGKFKTGDDITTWPKDIGK